MPLLLSIRQTASGEWAMTGLAGHPEMHFADLSEGLAYAKQQCRAAPAMIELIAGGMYMAVSQEEGWPARLFAAEVTPRRWPERRQWRARLAAAGAHFKKQQSLPS